MNDRRRSRLALVALLGLAACSLQAKPTLSALDQAGTIVALTLPPGGGPSPKPLAKTPSASAAPATATTKPTLFINTSGAKCMSGAGGDFKAVASFSSGTTVDMIAKDTAHGYWFVKDPTSGTSCWVRVQDATPAGSFDLLPDVTAEVSAIKPPAKPGSLTYGFSCDNTSLSTNLSWGGSGDNVNGYRVYRQGTQIADMPASTTNYTDSVSYNLGTQITFSVEAYNDAGASPQRSITIHCP